MYGNDIQIITKLKEKYEGYKLENNPGKVERYVAWIFWCGLNPTYDWMVKLKDFLDKETEVESV